MIIRCHHDYVYVLTVKPGKPDAPAIAKVTNTSVSLSWTPPEDDGDAEIFNYIVEYRAEGAKQWTRATKDHVSELKYTVPGLKKTKVYEFRISAENRAGVGPASEPTKPVKVEEPLGGCSHATASKLSFHRFACHGPTIWIYKIEYVENLFFLLRLITNLVFLGR